MQVTGRLMKKIGRFGCCSGVLFAACSTAIAADVPPDMPVKAPSAYVTKGPPAPAATDYDWNGFYVGGHAGLATGNSGWTLAPLGGGAPVSGSFGLYQSPD